MIPTARAIFHERLSISVCVEDDHIDGTRLRL
jgi:hypothetical protein